MNRGALAVPLADVLEQEFAHQVYELARLTSWLRYHTYRSKRSPKGFPDEVLVRERVVYLELKREKGRCTPEQKKWLRALRDAGQEVYVVRPRNLDALATVLMLKAPKAGARTLVTYGLSELRTELNRELAA